MTDLEFLPSETPGRPRSQRAAGLGMVALIAAILTVAAVIGIALIRSTRGPLDSGRAPAFAVTTFAGQTLSMDDLRGQVIVLNFWASWCLPCRDEAPALEAIWRQYGSRGVTVVGIAWSDIEGDSRAFIEQFDLSYPNAPDVGTRIGDHYGIRAVPETYVIDQDGNIRHRLIGVAQVTVENLGRLLNPLLEG